MKNDKEFIELVLARLSTMPENIQIHMGGNKSLNKEEIIKSVEKQDDIGKMYVMLQKEYIKASMKGFANA